MIFKIIFFIFSALLMQAHADPNMNVWQQNQQAIQQYQQYQQANAIAARQFQERMQQAQQMQQARQGYGGGYGAPIQGYGGYYMYPQNPGYGPGPEYIEAMRQRDIQQQQRQAEQRRQEVERQQAIAQQREIERQQRQAELQEQALERQRQQEIAAHEQQRQQQIAAREEAKQQKILAKQEEKERKRQDKLAREEQARQAKAARAEQARQANMARQAAYRAARELTQFKTGLQSTVLWSISFGLILLFIPGYREYAQHSLFNFGEWSSKAPFIISCLSLGIFAWSIHEGFQTIEQGYWTALAGVVGIPAAFYVPGLILLTYNFLHYLFVPHPAEAYIERAVRSQGVSLEDAQRAADAMYQPNMGDVFDEWRAHNRKRRIEAMAEMLKKENEAMEGVIRNQKNKANMNY